MGLDLDYIYGQTPLDEEEKDGLLISTISTKKDLNEFEQLNIEQAVLWIISKNFSREQVFSEDFIKLIHRKMFNEVWAWAGQFRKTDKNLGVPWYQISIQLKALLDDANCWIENHSIPPDEIAITFKHHLVSIHCFPNGNGRHSRIMADIIIEKLFNADVFSWGSKSLVKPKEVRKKYIDAIHKADDGILQPLLEFARS